MKTGLLARASLRFYLRHPWQLLLAIAGIALGVAVFVGIELANDSARRAFDASTLIANEQTTHRLLPLAGRLPQTVYTDLKRDRRYAASAPIVETAVTVALGNGRSLDLGLEGIDVIEETAVRGLQSVLGVGVDPIDLITEPAAAVIPGSVAARLGLERGQNLPISIGGRSAEVVIVGINDREADGPGRLVLDIAAAQELTGMLGSLTRIDLRLDPTAAESLAANPPRGTVLVPAGTADQTLSELTRAFNTNLTALGLLALVVGMFLIYSTISFTIVQRSRPIAVMRALGLERRELLFTLLSEAAAIGVVGTAIGLLLGRELSAGLLELVLRTLDDLYFRRALAAAEPATAVYVFSAVLGAGATILSALVPSVAASRRDITEASRSQIERGARDWSRRFAVAALPTAALAALLLWLADRGLWQGFVALFLVIVAGAMTVPLATHALMRLLERPLVALGGLPGRMAARGVTDSLSRTGIATAALTVAVATVMSIGLMIASFRISLIEWIDSTVTADIYLDVDVARADEGDAIVAAVEALPEVLGTSRMRAARIVAPGGSFNLRAQQPGPEGYGIDITAPDVAAEELLARDNAVLVAEPLAYRLDLAPGDRLELPTASALESFEVAGIYRDYNTAGAELLMTLASYRDNFADTGISSIGVHLAPGVDPEAAIATLRSRLGPDRSNRIRSTRFIREISLVIFDQTFQITEVLRLLAGIVAFLGILSALMALGLEREREFAVLRSLGTSVRQLFAQNLAQTGLLGLAAGIAAIPLGTALAWLLVHVINRRSFGWSMDFIVPAEVLASGVLMAVAAALLAGIYPALVGARADMGLAWRDD